MKKITLHILATYLLLWSCMPCHAGKNNPTALLRPLAALLKGNENQRKAASALNATAGAGYAGLSTVFDPTGIFPILALYHGATAIIFAKKNCSPISTVISGSTSLGVMYGMGAVGGLTLGIGFPDPALIIASGGAFTEAEFGFLNAAVAVNALPDTCKEKLPSDHELCKEKK